MSQRAEPAGADPWPGNAGPAGHAARADLTDRPAPTAGKVSPANRAAPPGDDDDLWMPDALEDWALDVPDEAWEDWLGTEPPQPPEALPAGLLPHDRGDGAGFAAGGVADRLVPDVALAGFARDAWANGLDRLSDDELIGLLRAWRRLNSWAAAGELAAVTELTNRRIAQVAAGADPHLAEHVGDELAASLTLTARGADALLEFACGLARLPLTRAALAAGQIDRAKALVITDGVSGLDDEHAAAVESAVIRLASSRTTGQLRAATQRAVLSADPSAARRRRERAMKDARVEVWDEQFGTSALAGRDLPPADVLAADKRIDALARHLKTTGLDGTLDQLRARVYTALLLGHPVESLEPPPGEPVRAESAPGKPARREPARAKSAPGETGQGETVQGEPAGAEPARQSGQDGAVLGRDGPLITGSVNLTMPLTTWLGAAEEPGDAAGFGPIPADDARALADLIASQPGTRWCLTLTDRDGRPIGHGCARAGPNRRRPAQPRADRNSGAHDKARREEAGQDDDGRGRTGQARAGPDRTSRDGIARDRAERDSAGQDDGWALTVTVRSLAVGDCSHERETAGYRPSPSLQHVINVRGRTCTFPGCRRPAVQCDQDHTIPYDQGGRTCECNLACLCRRHHQAKQAECWQLDQPEPGVLVWRLPHGRSYRVEPDRYP
jgi:hypothetical protein